MNQMSDKIQVLSKDGIDANRKLDRVPLRRTAERMGEKLLLSCLFIYRVHGVVSFTRKILSLDVALVSVERLEGWIFIHCKGYSRQCIVDARLGKRCTD